MSTPSSSSKASRKSQRLAVKGPRAVEGPTHFDLTTESGEEGMSMKVEESAIPLQSVKPNMKFKKMSMTLAFPLYQNLKASGSQSLLLSFLKEGGYETEMRFLQEAEKEGFIEKGEAEKFQKKVESEMAEYTQKLKEDEDENTLRNFKSRLGVAASVQGTPDNLFRNDGHEASYNELFGRDVMYPRTVDFDLLDSIGVDFRSLFAELDLEIFCSEKIDSYAELTAYFYSNLSMLAPDRLRFTHYDQDYEIDASLLADILALERQPFMPIRAEPCDIKLYVAPNSDNYGYSYSEMSEENTLLHKIVINCLRPKGSSKTDVSKTEARLMYAILSGTQFSLPHTILFHMYNSITKDKGQLPYAAVVARIYDHFSITIPKELSVNKRDNMLIGAKMIGKMKVPNLIKKIKAVELKSVEKTKKKGISGKGKKKMKEIESQKRKRGIHLRDEEKEEEATLQQASELRKKSRADDKAVETEEEVELIGESVERDQAEGLEKEEVEQEAETVGEGEDVLEEEPPTKSVQDTPQEMEEGRSSQSKRNLLEEIQQEAEAVTLTDFAKAAAKEMEGTILPEPVSGSDKEGDVSGFSPGGDGRSMDAEEIFERQNLQASTGEDTPFKMPDFAGSSHQEKKFVDSIAVDALDAVLANQTNIICRQKGLEEEFQKVQIAQTEMKLAQNVLHQDFLDFKTFVENNLKQLEVFIQNLIAKVEASGIENAEYKIVKIPRGS